MLDSRRRFPPLALVLLFLLASAAGCDDDGTGPAVLTEAEAADIAAFFSERATLPDPGSTTATAALGSGLFAPPFTFEATIECPIDGTFDVAAQGERTPDAAARRTAVSWSVIVAHDGCTFLNHADRMVAISSEDVTGHGSALWAWPAEQGGEFDMLEFELERGGSIDWAIDDRSGTCDLSLTSTYHAATDSWTTTGTVCGHDVESNRAPLGRG